MANRLDEIAAMIGRQNLIVLARRYGGREVSVPTVESITEKHPLVFHIGLEPAKALARAYGGEAIQMPPEVSLLLTERNEEIVRRFVGDGTLEGGERIRSLSLDFGLDRAMIQKIVDKAGHRDLRISRSVTYT